MARRKETAEKVEFRIVDVCDEFDDFLAVYDASTPFDRAGQLASHRRTMELRRSIGGLSAAVASDEFVRSLYETLAAWNMNQRAARLVGLKEFAVALRELAPQLIPFENSKITEVDGIGMAARLGDWVRELGTSPVANRVVTATKTIHHLLPDLIPPMDRAYTRVFFHWHMSQFQYDPTGFIMDAYPKFGRIAKAVQPEAAFGEGWRTSATKLLDNAIVGYCVVKKLELD